MGITKGGLYYADFFWKCNDGLRCVSDDIMAIINGNFSKYKEAPSKLQIPNKTSWRVFKAAVDKRREQGLPDIIVPKSVTGPQNMTLYETSVDQRVTEFFQKTENIHVYLNGTAWSQIVNGRSVNLFNIEGNVLVTVTKSATGSGFYTVSVTGAVFYRDIQTGSRLSSWTNLLTGTTVDVPNPLVLNGVKFEFPTELVYTMVIPTSGDIGLIAAQSSEIDTTDKTWEVNIAEIIFDKVSFKEQSGVFFSGTAVKFSSWLDWMNMGNMSGNIAMKATIYRDSHDFPHEALFVNTAPGHRVTLQYAFFLATVAILIWF